VSEAAQAVLLTAAAEADLEEIRAYTEETWGEARWLAYFGDILEAFERIAAFPRSGRARDAFAPGLRSVRCREHVIFYLPDVGSAVVVQRIVHGAQNVEALDWSERNGS
jgi:toxin ParE1/3/4